MRRGAGVFGSRPADGVFEIVGADEQLLDDNPRERSEIPGVGHFVRLRAPITNERLEWFEVRACVELHSAGAIVSAIFFGGSAPSASLRT